MNIQKHPANLLIIFGSAAIIIGGLLSAFSAHSAEYFTAWSVAYLVLVVGVVQVALGIGVRQLAKKPVSFRLLLTAFLLFNLGNAAVITSTVLYYTSTYDASYLVPIGSICIAAAMALFLRLVQGAKKSKGLIAYRLLLCFVLISVIVGLFL